MPSLAHLLLSAIVLSAPVISANHLTAAPPRHTAAHGRRQDTSTYETTSPLPLTDYHYPFSAIPEKVNPYAIGRGPQSGYNLCNSTTEGPTSDCQTMVFNNLTDFCLWGSPTANGLIGDVEAIVVAYCTQSGHGTRVMPAGTIQGAQFMRTSAYIQIVGFLDQTGVGLNSADYGGELDPHGADLLGNPLGGLVYSKSMPSGDNTTYMQVSSWNNFVGSNMFCMKLCDPTINTPNYCQNIFDLIGCEYNMPADYAAINGTFTSCEGDLQDEVGTYTSNGQTYTWSQPSSLPATSTLPWTPRVPASSNCVTYSSEELFGTPSTTSAAASATGTGASASANVSGKSGSSGTAASGSSSPAATGSSSSAAGKLSVGSGMLAVVAAAMALL